MKLPEFLYCENRTELTGAMILCTKSPWWVGQVHKFKSELDCNTWLLNHDYLSWAHVISYNIIVVAHGALLSPTPVTPSILQELDRLMVRMAGFYYEEKIKSHPGYYKRYRGLTN